MLATVIPSFPSQDPGTQLSPAGEGKARGEQGVWRGGQGPGLRPRASALGRITRGASTTFCSLPCTGGRGPFSLIPDPSPRMLARTLPSAPSTLSILRELWGEVALPALSPQQRGGDSGVPSWWRGLSGAAVFAWSPAWVLLILVPDSLSQPLRGGEGMEFCQSKVNPLMAPPGRAARSAVTLNPLAP